MATACDRLYAPHAAALLHSVRLHNRDARFLLIDCGLSRSDRESLRSLATTIGAELRIEQVAESRLDGLPTSEWSAAVYARLAIPDILPADCRRALYLDADCIVVDDLTELWSTDLGDHVAGGVVDTWARAAEAHNGRVRNLPPVYVNAGVMLMNLPAWRERRLAESIVDYVRTHQPRYNEQTAINVLAAGAILTLPERWNFMVHKWHVEPARITPKVIHYTGLRRPWAHRDTLLAEVYRHHRNATPFAAPAPSAWYRPPLRRLAGLASLRRTDWRRRAAARYYRSHFTEPYLERVLTLQAAGQREQQEP